jgi:hypothetical protein
MKTPRILMAIADDRSAAVSAVVAATANNDSATRKRFWRSLKSPSS